MRSEFQSNKILCVIDSLCAGGAQRQLVEVACGLQDKGNIVSFLTYHNIPFYEYLLKEAGIPVLCIEEPNYLKRLFKMRRYIRKSKFDVVLSFLEAPNFICEFAGIPFRNWKLIVGERSANPNILNSFKLSAYRWFHLFSDHVVANSNANMRLVRLANPFLRKSKCKVIYNLVDFNRNKPKADYTPRKNQQTHIVIAGRQAYPKNLPGLVNALILLDKEERKKIKIHWYGDRAKNSQMQDITEEAYQKIELFGLKNVIEFSPACKNIEEKLQESDAVGLFSLYEGFPNVVCEGMACAKPVICSSVSDVPNILSHNSRLLCNPKDPQSIKQAIINLIYSSDDQLIEMGYQNEKVAKKMFNKETILDQYIQLLNTKYP